MNLDTFEALVNGRCIMYAKPKNLLSEERIVQLLVAIHDWSVTKNSWHNPALVKTFFLPGLKQEDDFKKKLGLIADEQRHHPFYYSHLLNDHTAKLSVYWTTDSLGGITRNDFIMAAKTNQLFTKHFSV